MTKPTETFNFSEPILNTTKLGFFRLKVYKSVFNVNRRNYKFLYDGKAWSETHVLAVIPGAYQLIEIAELLKEETNGNVIIDPDKKTMKNQCSLNFDIENSIAPLLGFRKTVFKQGKYTSQEIIDVLGISSINIHCNVISGVKYNGSNTDILYTFTLIEPPDYLKNIIPTNFLYQNVTKDRIEYIEFHNKDEHGRQIDFKDDVLSFTLHLTYSADKGSICINTAGRRPICYS